MLYPGYLDGAAREKTARISRRVRELDKTLQRDESEHRVEVHSP